MEKETFIKIIDITANFLGLLFLIFFLGWGAEYLLANEGLGATLGILTAIIIYTIKVAESRIMAKLRGKHEED